MSSSKTAQGSKSWDRDAIIRELEDLTRESFDKMYDAAKLTMIAAQTTFI
ncbi:MAG TPA: hypothetical protein P5096_03485 [Patescibacteria group bacterium]|nr:hypothetical protein [Patescibacteria group bacterium]